MFQAISLASIAVLTVIDQLTKYAAVATVKVNGPKDFLFGLMQFRYVENTGAAWGALDGKRWMFIPFTAADCCEDTSAIEAFDATFPPKEKKWMPSQEEFYIYSHSSVVR